MERRWLGASQRTDCGLAGYDRCQLLTDLTLQLSLDIRQCRLQQFRSTIDTFGCHLFSQLLPVYICRTYKLCLTPARTTCSKSFSVEKYQPNHTNKDLLSLTISVRETTPKYYSSGDPREKIKLFYEELSRFSEGEDGELGEVEMQAEEEKRRLHEIMQRMLETFLIILITVSTILCVCLLCLLKFC